MSGPEVTSGRDNRRRRPKGYAEWRPQAKTRVLLEQVFAVLEEYRESDSRSAAWSGETCQLEALSPEVLAEVVDAAIAKWIRGETLTEQLEREGQDVAELWRGLPRGAA